jgi:hypothetical protein
VNGIRKFTASAALIVLVCFFLPWVQVSCGGAHDTSSGVGLARAGELSLWLLPVLMLAVILFAIGRLLNAERIIFGLISLVCGLISIYLMNQERSRFADASGLINASLTGWFWLGLMSAVAVAIGGAANILRRPPSP